VGPFKYLKFILLYTTVFINQPCRDEVFACKSLFQKSPASDGCVGAGLAPALGSRQGKSSGTRKGCPYTNRVFEIVVMNLRYTPKHENCFYQTHCIFNADS
jgi:hypothetical protein